MLFKNHPRFPQVGKMRKVYALVSSLYPVIDSFLALGPAFFGCRCEEWVLDWAWALRSGRLGKSYRKETVVPKLCQNQ